MSRTAGSRVITERLPFGSAHRDVSVHLPSVRPTAAVVAVDGATVATWGALLERSGIPPTMVVGVHGPRDETRRLEEYSPVFDTERFAAHERFVTEDVPRWVEKRFEITIPAERTAVYGASAGGEFALAAGLRHPELYGTILSASPGAGYRPPGALTGRIPRVYLVAGTAEPFFLENATRWADALRDAGATVVLRARPGDHGSTLWRGEFPRMVTWAFAGPDPIELT